MANKAKYEGLTCKGAICVIAFELNRIADSLELLARKGKNTYVGDK